MKLLDGGLQLDKLWQAAQTVIGGWSDPLEPLLTGEAIGADLSYGPAVLAAPAEIQRVSADLAGLTEDELIQRFDATELGAAGAYPDILDEPPDELAREVGSAAWRLVSLCHDVATEGKAIVAAIM